MTSSAMGSGRERMPQQRRLQQSRRRHWRRGAEAEALEAEAQAAEAAAMAAATAAAGGPAPPEASGLSQSSTLDFCCCGGGEALVWSEPETDSTIRRRKQQQADDTTRLHRHGRALLCRSCCGFGESDSPRSRSGRQPKPKHPSSLGSGRNRCRRCHDDTDFELQLGMCPTARCSTC